MIITTLQAFIGVVVSISQTATIAVSISPIQASIDLSLIIRQTITPTISLAVNGAIPIFDSILSSDDFSVVPDRGLSVSSKPETSIEVLGDGYAYKSAKGMNNYVNTWNLRFKNRPSSIIDAIDTFLIGKKGYISFTWTPPGETIVRRVVCEKWSVISNTQTRRTLQASFREVLS